MPYHMKALEQMWKYIYVDVVILCYCYLHKSRIFVIVKNYDIYQMATESRNVIDISLKIHMSS